MGGSVEGGSHDAHIDLKEDTKVWEKVCGGSRALLCHLVADRTHLTSIPQGGCQGVGESVERGPGGGVEGRSWVHHTYVPPPL